MSLISYQSLNEVNSGSGGSREEVKHCQRHNGPMVLPLQLELSLQLIKRMPLALVPKATKWHHLHQLQIWPPDGALSISYKFGHQIAPLALLASMANRRRHLH